MIAGMSREPLRHTAVMRARPSSRLAEAVRPVPALRARAWRRLIVGGSRRRTHTIALRVRIARAFDERAVGLERKREPRQVSGESVDRDLTPAVLTAGEADGCLAREPGDGARAGVRSRSEADGGCGVAGGVGELRLCGECGGRQAHGEDDGSEFGHWGSPPALEYGAFGMSAS